jgi:NTE family protein
MDENVTHNRKLFEKALAEINGTLEPELIGVAENQIEWINIHAGEYLFYEGDKSDALYIVLRGRLTAWRKDKTGEKVKLGDIKRAQPVGELAMFTGDDRSADVIAARDSLLGKLPKATFLELLAKSPRFSVETTRLIIERFNNANQLKTTSTPGIISVIATDERLDIDHWAKKFYTELSQYGSVEIVNSKRVDSELDQEGIAQNENPHSEEFLRVANFLDQLEEKHDFLIYLADKEETPWTARCKRQADRVILLADGTASSELSAIEKEGLDNDLIPSSLVLIHSNNTVLPKNTAQWLDKRPWLADHFHIRKNHETDMARLVRILSGNAIGLVLAGGGAKGFAHIGIFRALREYNIPIDIVGGTSIGGTVAAAIALDQPDKNYKYLKKAALFNPTKDFNWWPIISLMKGGRVDKMIENAIQDFTGSKDVNMEDAWLSFFVISSNFTQARQEVHRRGSLKKNLLASIAIPGVFPPVVHGNDLLIDGATFNNFPVDVMVAMQPRKVIGSDLVVEKKYELKFTKTPTTWQLLRDRLRPKKKRIYRLPGITSMLLNTTILFNTSKRAENSKMLDLLFKPNLAGFGITKWTAFDQIVDAGYVHAKEVLSKLNKEELDDLRGKPGV